MRRHLLALVALWLGGCASAPGGAGVMADYQSLAAADGAVGAHDVDERDLLVRIPDWAGAVLRARQYDEGGVLRQEIVFAGGTRGDHLIEASLATRNPAALRQPSDAEIETELATKFPGVAMRIVPAPSQDSIGSDRIAIGRASDGTRCLYDWRWMADLRVASDSSGIASVAAMFSQKPTPALLRIHLCSKYVSLDDLASLARQIQVAPLPDLDRIISGRSAATNCPARIQTNAPGPTLESAFGASDVALPARRTVRGPPHDGKRLAHRSSTLQPNAGASIGDDGQRFLAPPPSGYATEGAAERSSPRGAGGLRDLTLPAAAFRGPPTGSPTMTTSGSQ